MFSRGDRGPQAPQVIDGGQVDVGAPWGPREPGVRQIRAYTYRPEKKTNKGDRDRLSGSLLTLAGGIIAASLGGAAYVAYESQRLFAYAHNHHDETRAAIIGALPDAGWISMAVVALVAALKGRSSLRARVGVVIFFGLSLGAQMMYAPRNPEGWLVAVIAPITLAWMLESFVVEVRRWALNRRGVTNVTESPILATAARASVRGLVCGGRLLLWVVRLAVAPKETGGGLKGWILDEAPLAPGRTRQSLRAAAAVEQAGVASQSAVQARAEAAELIAKAHRDADEQINAARADAEQYAAQMRAEADARYKRLMSEANAKIERLNTVNTDLAADVDRLREELETLAGRTTAKARMHTLYEQLGRSGDPRYLDRTYIREVARELGPRAGLQSEGTADAYLRQYIDANGGANEPVGGRDTARNGAMIGVNGS